MMSFLRRTPIHPLLFLSFPVLFMLSVNVDQVEIDVLWRPLLTSLALGGILWALAAIVLRKSLASAFVVSGTAVLFFSYGHLYAALRGFGEVGAALGRHRFLLPLWLLLFVGFLWWLRTRRDLLGWTSALNLVGLLLVLMPLLQVGTYMLRSRRAEARHTVELLDPATGEPIALPDPAVKPDVYFLVFDAYGREDVLLSLFDIDNSEFIAGLEDRGFYVAVCSQSNYAQSELSLASTLNMAYLEDLGDRFVPDSDDKSPLRPFIKQSLVRALLEGMGYQTVAFETGYGFSELKTADRYFAPRGTALGPLSLSGGLSGFEVLLLRSSGGLILLDASKSLPRYLVPDVDHEIREHRRRVLLALETLEGPEQFEGPTFVFGHIVSPHRPFLFGPGGQAVVEPERPPVDDDEEVRFRWYRRGYTDQIAYLNDRILAIVDALLAEEEVDPIIILQSDHGPEEGGSRDRMRILNAYRLPPPAQASLYSDITPVNSFRVLLNGAFGADLPLLPDQSLFSTYNRPYDFRVIRDRGCVLEKQ